MASETVQAALIEVIKEKLLSGKPAEIPGLGIFESVHIPATAELIDSTAGERATSLSPPRTEIRFSPEETE